MYGNYLEGKRSFAERETTGRFFEFFVMSLGSGKLFLRVSSEFLPACPYLRKVRIDPVDKSFLLYSFLFV